VVDNDPRFEGYTTIVNKALLNIVTIEVKVLLFTIIITISPEKFECTGPAKFKEELMNIKDLKLHTN
jgi:hypothetical protein